MVVHTDHLALIKPPLHEGRDIWLVRHGETPWNAEKRFQGHTDIPLNPKGVHQAQQLGAYLAALSRQAGVTSIFQQCVSSDLQRAHHTAQLLMSPWPHASILLNAGLRERNYGALAGLTGQEMSTQFPDDFDALQKRKPEHVLPSGESLQQFYDRIVETFTDVLKQHPTGRLLVVAHGGVLDCIYRHCTGEPLPTPRQWLLPNAAINVIRQSKPQTLEVLRWADQHHLNSATGEDEVDGRIT